jgi:glycosyltransferase involved in cell wall biosynthesis
MNIAIDCRHLDSSGVGVYLKGCLPFFLDSEHNFLLLGNPEKLAAIVSSRKNVEIFDCNVKPFSLQEILFFQKKYLAKINAADVYYSPFFNVPSGIKVPVFTTIHDIIFPDMPELVSKIGLFARMRFYQKAFVTSKKIFTVSHFSKQRIEFYSRKQVPVVVTYSAIQQEILSFSKAQKNKNVVKNNTIIFVGNIKKHKGLEYLVDAFYKIKKQGFDFTLVIVGSKDNFRTRDNSVLEKIHAHDSDSVFFTGHISDSELFEYLAKAALLVQPSLYEGFGLPPLEALVLGTRALVSDIPVFKEIYNGFPVTFFKAGDSDDLENKLLEMLKEKETEFELPKELAATYIFEKTAAVIMNELTQNNKLRGYNHVE